MVGIACLVDFILYTIVVGKITARSMGTILHYCRQNFKHNSNFILKMVADLIELNMWPLCKRGVAESMDDLDPPLALSRVCDRAFCSHNNHASKNKWGERDAREVGRIGHFVRGP